jgi:hypothetical protein
VTESVHVEVPRRELGDDLAAALQASGLEARVIEDGDQCRLEVRYAADEQERLLGDVAHAIEGWLGDQELPLVVERADGACVVRPPAN